MKTSKEFIERLQSDEAFAKEFAGKVKKKIDDGETDPKSVWTPLAAEYGYELTAEEVEEMSDKAAGELSDEELGKVAGGTTPTLTTFLSITCITKVIDMTMDLAD